MLLSTTATVAVVHALLGIDHSLPFIALGGARRWSLRYTAVWILCQRRSIMRYADVVAGLVMAASGAAVLFL